ncbi:hypothetical protein D3C87_1266770 [compost metagenome]
MHDQQHQRHDSGIGDTHWLRIEARQTRPLPRTEGHDQSDEQRKAGPLEQEKPAQGNRQQDQRSDDSLFKH